MAESGVVPEALANRPRPTEWTAEYYAGFMLIIDSRSTGMGGVGSVPLSEVVALLDVLQVDDQDDRELWARMMRVLDNVYVKHYSDKQKAEQERASLQRK